MGSYQLKVLFATGGGPGWHLGGGASSLTDAVKDDDSKNAQAATILGDPLGTYTVQVDWDTSAIIVDGVPTDVGALPAGFTPTDATLTFKGNFATPSLAPTNLSVYLNVDSGFNESTEQSQTFGGGSHTVSITYGWTPVPSLVALLAATAGVRAVLNNANAECDVNELTMTGSYVIVNTAWVIPNPATSPDGTGEAGTGSPYQNGNDVRNACGVPIESHVVISGSSPGADYVALGTPPTPVIDSVTPPSGSKYGGELVTIRGAGFDDAATVTFDGDAATSVTVVSQFEITCDTPAHAAGSTDVVVTNSDGSHS